MSERISRSLLAAGLALTLLLAARPSLPGGTARAVFCNVFPCYTLTVKLSGDGSGSWKTTDNSGNFDGAIDCEEVNGVITVNKCSATFQDLSGNGLVIFYDILPTPGSCRLAFGACDDNDYDDNIFLTATTTTSAEFDLHLYAVDMPAVVGGHVTSSPAGIACPTSCSTSFKYGTHVTLTETPDSGYAFVGWHGDVCGGTSSTCEFTVLNASAPSASFAPLYGLSVTAGGSGSGTITSKPAGIDCTYSGTNAFGCAGKTAAQFASGTKVSVIAAPASGSTFGGWTGAACAGQGSTCMFTISAAALVGGTFLARPGPTSQGSGATGTPTERPVTPTSPPTTTSGPPSEAPLTSFPGSSPTSSEPERTSTTPSETPGASSGTALGAASATSPADLTPVIAAIVLGAGLIAVAIIVFAVLMRRRA